MELIADILNHRLSFFETKQCNGKTDYHHFFRSISLASAYLKFSGKKDFPEKRLEHTINFGWSLYCRHNSPNMLNETMNGYFWVMSNCLNELEKSGLKKVIVRRRYGFGVLFGGEE